MIYNVIYCLRNQKPEFFSEKNIRLPWKRAVIIFGQLWSMSTKAHNSLRKIPIKATKHNLACFYSFSMQDFYSNRSMNIHCFHLFLAVYMYPSNLHLYLDGIKVYFVHLVSKRQRRNGRTLQTVCLIIFRDWKPSLSWARRKL